MKSFNAYHLETYSHIGPDWMNSKRRKLKQDLADKFKERSELEKRQKYLISEIKKEKVYKTELEIKFKPIKQDNQYNLLNKISYRIRLRNFYSDWGAFKRIDKSGLTDKEKEISKYRLVIEKAISKKKKEATKFRSEENVYLGRMKSLETALKNLYVEMRIIMDMNNIDMTKLNGIKEKNSRYIGSLNNKINRCEICLEKQEIGLASYNNEKESYDSKIRMARLKIAGHNKEIKEINLKTGKANSKIRKIKEKISKFEPNKRRWMDSGGIFFIKKV